MATLPAPRTSTVKWQIVERQTSSKIFDQKYSSGLEVFKKQKTFEKNRVEHGSFDFFCDLQMSLVKKNCAHIFWKKNLE